jgi:hypothetical protein
MTVKIFQFSAQPKVYKSQITITVSASRNLDALERSKTDRLCQIQYMNRTQIEVSTQPWYVRLTT